MLIDWKLQSNDPVMDKLFSAIQGKRPLLGLVEGDSEGGQYVEQYPGIYLIGHFSGDHMLPRGMFDKYPSGLSHGPYGVCDGVMNLLEKMPELAQSEREFIVTLTCIRHDEQEEQGGWRWHKWGEYIGKHNPQCEYLYDEVGIEQVYCYHVYEKVKVLAITDLKHGKYYGTSGMSSFFDGVRWDGQAGKFKAFVYDDDTKEMVIRELEYSPQWFEYTREPVFAPVFVWQEPIRRLIRFDNEPPLLES